VQAFPIMTSSTAGLQSMLLPATDGFAINYGTGAIGAEIIANRFGVGPMGSCADCRFEEFFLSAWTVGDAAMLVDYPANTPCAGQPANPDINPTTPPPGQPTSAPCTMGVAGNAPTGITPYRKATKALYSDDPSNVYHSYINDRVKFRVLHTGTGVSHVHHLHAHQWVHSPNSDGST
jgi:manganese oxidase